MPKLLTGESVRDYELLPCLFNGTTWLEPDKTYGSEWWNPLYGLEDAAEVARELTVTTNPAQLLYGKAYPMVLFRGSERYFEAAMGL